MRKALVMFLIIGLLAFIVACNPDSSLNEELVNVTISSRDTRALEASTNFNINDVRTWKYTAKKADNGLKTGETTEQVELIDGKTQQLSQGSWNFELFGYKGEDLICVGEAPNTTITVDKHIISILVSPQQTTNGKGKIDIDSNISIASKDGKPVSATINGSYTRTVTVRSVKDSNFVKTDELILTGVSSGMYSVTVEYTAKIDGVDYTAAVGIKYFNVYDNLTTKISGTVEEKTQAGIAEPNTPDVVASVDGVLYDDIAKALEVATVTKPLTLMKDATLKQSLELTHDAAINLNNNTLTFVDGQNITIKGNEPEAKVTISNGSIVGPNGCSTIKLDTNSDLTLDSVNITANTVGNENCIVFLLQKSNPAKLTVKNSTLIMDGAYCIGTNASDWKNTNVEITIEKSTIISQNNNGQSVGLFVNVPAIVNVSDSYIEGEQLGALFRGISKDSAHIAKIKDTTITSKNSEPSEYQNKEWKTGLEIPSAALVVGNRCKTSYNTPTTVLLDNVELKSGNGVDIFAYQNNEVEKVVVAGTVKGECIVNSDSNATVFPEAKIGGTYYQTLGDAVNSVEKDGKATITLSHGLTTKLVSIDNKTITFVGDDSQTFDMSDAAVACHGANLTFEHVNFKGSTKDYIGIEHVNSVTYNNCNFTAKRFLYGNVETFNDCSFSNTDGDYSVWTYGASNVYFNSCKFYGNKKCIYIYNEGTVTKFNVNISNCTFEGGQDDGTKAAISTGDTKHTLEKITLTISGSDFSKWVGIEANSKSNIWGNKDNLDASKLDITIDGSKVYLKRIATSEELKKALTALASAGSGNNTIEIDGDFDLKDGETWTPVTIDGYHGAGVITINGNGHTISGLNASLLAGGFAGNSGVVIKDLTLDKVTINDSKNEQGLGAFIGCIDSMPKIELNNCHLTNSSIISTGGARVGGLIGWTSGYKNPNNGPVDTYITINNCSVENCEITAKGSVGGIIGHAGANPATYHTISDCTVKNTKLNSTDNGDWRVGVVVGTANVGEVTIKGTIESGNTLTQTDKTAPAGQSNLYGRFVPSTTGKLTIDGNSIK